MSLLYIIIFNIYSALNEKQFVFKYGLNSHVYDWLNQLLLIDVTIVKAL